MSWCNCIARVYCADVHDCSRSTSYANLFLLVKMDAGYGGTVISASAMTETETTEEIVELMMVVEQRLKPVPERRGLHVSRLAVSLVS